MTPERVHVMWCGWDVPLGDGVGRVVLATGTTLVCRLQSRSGPTIVTLHADATRPRSPAAIALRVLPAASAGSAVTIRDGVVRVLTDRECFDCDVGSATRWPPPSRPPLHARSRRALCVKIGRAAPSALAQAQSRLGGRVAELVDALHCHGESVVAAPVRRLIGFGPGLTPSGDDFLCGVLVTLARSVEHASAYAVLARAVQEALAGVTWPTTDPGVALLRLAVRGECDEAVADVLASAQMPSSACGERIRRLLAVGATSGADVLVGIHAALGVGMLAGVAGVAGVAV